MCFDFLSVRQPPCFYLVLALDSCESFFFILYGRFLLTDAGRLRFSFDSQQNHEHYLWLQLECDSKSDF